jgi:FixJ family two-component response regulator
MPLISIVDDDLSVRRALRRLVRSAGYTAETFASAHEFLDSVPSRRVACLVLDIHLNGMSGFELQERMAVDRAAIPIIFITAHDDAATRERARRTGVSAYLRKPFDEQVLLAAIGRAVGVDGHQRDGHERDGHQTPPRGKRP